MAIYAIADLHLPGGSIKPMDIFGAHWADHFDKICRDWRSRVEGEDVVLLPGDISWAMTLKDAEEDLRLLGALPGKKVLLRGNHDYWWNGINRVRRALPESVYAIQNDCISLDNAVICGTRGWLLPSESSSANDIKIYQREVQRLHMTLSQAQAHRVPPFQRLICMMHYPPLTEFCQDNGFTELLETYHVDDLVYGHLHGTALKGAFRGIYRGVRFHQVSCDGLDFKLYQVI